MTTQDKLADALRDIQQYLQMTAPSPDCGHLLQITVDALAEHDASPQPNPKGGDAFLGEMIGARAVISGVVVPPAPAPVKPPANGESNEHVALTIHALDVFKIAGGDVECSPEPTAEIALDCLRDLRQCYEEVLSQQPAAALPDMAAFDKAVSDLNSWAIVYGRLSTDANLRALVEAREAVKALHAQALASRVQVPEVTRDALDDQDDADLESWLESWLGDRP